jgi:hypothetical protein
MGKSNGWKIVMESGGGTCYDFMGGFDSEEAAVEVAESCDWHFTDENGFDWSLDVVEEENVSAYTCQATSQPAACGV